MLLFLAFAFLLEYLVVYTFLSNGLSDEFTWMETLQVPYVNWSFTLAVSPLLHLLPLSVIIVLIASWTFLTRYTAFIPHRIESAKKTAIRRRQPQHRRYKVVRNSFKRISRRFNKIRKTLREAFLRIPGFSKLPGRLFFARTAVRSALIILLTFICFALIAFSLAYPMWIHDAVVSFYRGNPSFISFVIGTQESLQFIRRALAPLNDALLAAAPSFRSGLKNLGTSAEPIAKLDVTEKYIFVQSLAAWICALTALVYGKYASARRHRRR